MKQQHDQHPHECRYQQPEYSDSCVGKMITKPFVSAVFCLGRPFIEITLSKTSSLLRREASIGRKCR
ncbi:hypothetical protein BS643_18105 [Pseudomonas protegens]|nr:hypothetical protein BBH57_22965 [Pseudomonas protegens]OBZ22501.1 hypothetical protein BBH58_17220 [Pseudomonas protegens]OKK41320.1 hypothetical protein BS643_18105 [Pseudomonas protegens]OKK43393.1 hypothetical protein BS644_22875 [Pseudomonas protegens]OKK55417.1 hypothetical protein BS646_29825 [Pseudomonas protegens]